tara:strand:+ start:2834 stop:2974 length:141 start_codon:yes stop_codon:yes gene_type:complete
MAGFLANERQGTLARRRRAYRFAALSGGFNMGKGLPGEWCKVFVNR